MVDIRINYETLFDLLRREKNREELQSLDKDFYEQVLAYLKEKKEALAKKGDELFASAEREKLKIQFQNIRRIIKELYERREKKIINMAMSKARTGSDVIDTSALLPSEKDFFDDQVSLFLKYKEAMLDRIINLKEFENNKAEEDKGPPLGQEKINEKEKKEESKKKDKQEIKKTETEQNSEAAGAPEKKKILITDSMPSFMGIHGEVLGPFEEGEEVE